MRRVLRVLVVAAVVLALAWALASLPGTVTAQIGDISFEAASPVMALGAAPAVRRCSTLLFRLLGATWRLPRTLRAQP